MLRQIYAVASKTSISTCELIIIDSHEAITQLLSYQNAIICDTHFIDYATLISAAYYSNSPHDIVRITNAMLADSLVKSDDIVCALDFAKKYINGPVVSAFHTATEIQLRKLVLAARSFQSFFAIRHELAHTDYQSKNSMWEPFFEYYRRVISEKVSTHNCFAIRINDIDLSPIQQELLRIKSYAKPAMEFPSSKDAVFRMKCVSQQINNLIIKERRKLSRYQDREWEEYQRILYFACDNFIRETKSAMLCENKFIEECSCDLLSIFELLDIGFESLDKCSARICAVESYLLCMLTQNMLLTAHNIQKYSHENVKSYVDNNYMRRFFEYDLLPALLNFYTLYHKDLSMEKDKESIIDAVYKASENVDLMYAIFSEYIFTLNFDDISEKHIPYSDQRWKECYSEIERILQFPV